MEECDLISHQFEKLCNMFWNEEENPTTLKNCKKLREPFSFKIDRFIKHWSFRIYCWWWSIKTLKKGNKKNGK